MFTTISPTFLHMFWMMVVLHCIVDFPLQGPFLSHAKNIKNPIKGVSWYVALAAHAMMHAGAVWWVTGNGMLGLLEFMAHGMIDHLKSVGAFEGVRANAAFNRDQLQHILCKLAWAGLWMAMSKL